MPHDFLVTVTATFGEAGVSAAAGGTGADLATAVANRLMDDGDVVTVRMAHRPGEASVFRLDARADAPAAAAAAAAALSDAAAGELGVRCRVHRVEVVRDDQRPTEPPWGVALGPVHAYDEAQLRRSRSRAR